LVEVKAAAAVLGVKPTTVRWHYKNGNLAGRKVGESLMINSESLEQFRAHRAEKRSA
jgi:Helix-turn-helix domain